MPWYPGAVLLTDGEQTQPWPGSGATPEQGCSSQWDRTRRSIRGRVCSSSGRKCFGRYGRLLLLVPSLTACYQSFRRLGRQAPARQTRCFVSGPRTSETAPPAGAETDSMTLLQSLKTPHAVKSRLSASVHTYDYTNALMLLLIDAFMDKWCMVVNASRERDSGARETPGSGLLSLHREPAPGVARCLSSVLRES